MATTTWRDGSAYRARVEQSSSPDDSSASEADLAARLFLLTDLINPYAIRVAANLHVADELTDGPKPATELAEVCGVLSGPLERLLRFLAQQDIFREVEPGYFALTPLAALLVGDGPLAAEHNSVHGQRVAASAAHMLHSIQSGQSAYEDLFGESVFEFCARDPIASASFQAAMSANSANIVEAAVLAYDWSHLKTFVDVGGCQGLLLAAILQANPAANGILFDREHVLNAPNCLTTLGVNERCSIVAGDFFSSVPSGGDCYLLCNVLHDWDDDAALKILTSCRAAMPPGSRLLIVDRIVPANQELHHAKYMDMRMLLVFGGMERTLNQFTSLLNEAAFAVTRVIPTESQAALIESIPVSP